MRKAFIILLSAILMLSMVSCGDTNHQTNSTNTAYETTTTTVATTTTTSSTESSSEPDEEPIFVIPNNQPYMKIKDPKIVKDTGKFFKIRCGMSVEEVFDLLGVPSMRGEVVNSFYWCYKKPKSVKNIPTKAGMINLDGHYTYGISAGAYVDFNALGEVDRYEYNIIMDPNEPRGHFNDIVNTLIKNKVISDQFTLVTDDSFYNKLFDGFAYDPEIESIDIDIAYDRYDKDDSFYSLNAFGIDDEYFEVTYSPSISKMGYDYPQEFRFEFYNTKYFDSYGSGSSSDGKVADNNGDGKIDEDDWEIEWRDYLDKKFNDAGV
ncbi:hypothetical protein [Ruminococcus sp. NK3A76]|uniref:hypothetical protein n=1 Tax=Ruminococcus sp. NK3A76 TaxID=877411 RepID=UPI00048C1A92|nr:hypothetical protein [Ruminococcus sp. NK3A76]